MSNNVIIAQGSVVLDHQEYHKDMARLKELEESFNEMIHSAVKSQRKRERKENEFYRKSYDSLKNETKYFWSEIEHKLTEDEYSNRYGDRDRNIRIHHGVITEELIEKLAHEKAKDLNYRALEKIRGRAELMEMAYHRFTSRIWIPWAIAALMALAYINSLYGQ